MPGDPEVSEGNSIPVPEDHGLPGSKISPRSMLAATSPRPDRLLCVGAGVQMCGEGDGRRKKQNTTTKSTKVSARVLVSGCRGLTVRSLRRRTHYAPSSANQNNLQPLGKEGASCVALPRCCSALHGAYAVSARPYGPMHGESQRLSM